jgi:hypothetical protein
MKMWHQSKVLGSQSSPGKSIKIDNATPGRENTVKRYRNSAVECLDTGIEMNLLSEWARWKPGKPPFVLEADRECLRSARGDRDIAAFGSWRTAVADPNFCKPNDTRLHLGLLPMPFIGDLRRASVYVLLLNPGWGPHDHYGEYEVPAYRKALLSNLKQTFSRAAIPFLFLDPRYSWHGGFRWWHGKLAKVILELSTSQQIPFATARAQLASKLASIELFPYHSSRFRDSGGWLRRLKSVELARAFVLNVVLPRIEHGEAIAIVARKAELWGLPTLPGVVRYSGQEARAAHLTPDSPGGRLILERLAKAKRRKS